MDRRPTCAIGRPGFRQRELGSEGSTHEGTTRRLIGHVGCADDDLTMGDLAKGPSILAGDTDRGTPLLGQSRVVEH